MAFWPTSVATDANLYIAVNNLQTTLSGSIDNVVTTITLASSTGFPTAGGVTIDTEVIFYTGISGAQLTGCTRGADGTTAASHSSGVPVGATVIAAHHNLLKDEIKAIETSLNLTASQLVVTSASGRVTTVAVTPTEAGYLAGVTSSIQTQLNATIANPLTSNLVAGSHKITGLAAPTTTNDALSYANLVASSDGTISAPGITFASDPDTGIYHSGTNTLDIAVGGLHGLQIDNNQNVQCYGHVAQNTALKQFLGADGSVSVPSFGLNNDSDTGFYSVSANVLGISAGGTQAARFAASGNASGTTYTPIVIGGAPNFLDQQHTSSITNSAVTILTISDDAAMVVVMGSDNGGSNSFIDLILCSADNSAAPTVVSSKTVAGSPAARTYTASGAAQKLSMASGTYATNAQSITMHRFNS